MRPRTRLAVTGLSATSSLRALNTSPLVDRRNGKIAEYGIGIAGERGLPFFAMLGVAPFLRIDGEVVLDALPERHMLSVFGPGGEHGTVAGLDRVEAAGELHVAIVPQLSRQCQR